MSTTLSFVIILNMALSCRLDSLSHYSKHVTVLQVELTSAEVESLRSEIADAEERESHLKAQYDLPDCLFHCSII